MPVVTDERKLATVETIKTITPIDGADNIVVATVKGWNVVVKKDEFVPGDKVVYFEEDTALPVSDLRYAFLAPRGVKTVDNVDYHILKIARLRGVYSQGLVLPVNQFIDAISTADDGPADGTDLTGALGLGKWEAPAPTIGGVQQNPFPTEYAQKTDAERVQNLTNVWDVISAHTWIPTEKMDGTSLTVIKDHNGQIHVCSRNWEIVEGDNLYWNVTRNFNLPDLLQPGEAIQAEICGNGVNGNRQDVKELRPYIFGFIRDRRPVPRAKWDEVVLTLATPQLDVPFPNSPQEALTQVDGIKSTVNPKRLSEGIVWHEATGAELVELGGRSVWKAINQKYLMKG